MLYYYRMNKINNKINLIFYSLEILAVLIFGILILPTKTNADTVSGTGWYYPNHTSGSGQNNVIIYETPIYAPAPIYISAPTPTPTIYSNSTNPNGTSAITKPKTIAKTKTTSVNNIDSNLAAGAIFGSNSFMPSGLIQWIFFAILVLLVVILIRKIYSGNEKYDAIPMKHN